MVVLTINYNKKCATAKGYARKSYPLPFKVAGHLN